MTSFAPSSARTVTALDLGLGSLRDRAAAEPGAGAARPRRWPVQRGAMAALGDRLPMWVRLRCGIAPRTLAALTAVLVVAVALGAYHFWAGRPRTVRVPAREGPVAAPPPAAVPTVPGPTVPGPGSSARSVVVDVTGKVLRPGVQRLPPGSRVEDALEAAGGARPGADTTGLNQARVLMDGELIVVGAPAPGGPAPAAGGSAAPSGGGVAAGPVSLNSATLQQLDALPGVGPVLAQHILDYRTQHGGFRSVADLRHVNGIGARRFTDLKPLVQP
ncbi:ComEA family DNA-binding protein [Streptomyces hesseae]|uniref:ComEA family DNA-binding protein n=1 Tax=Streptomyces hesseae TaxID=3075519 RepID=A0ABU2SRC9_9ACTN|nr:ComEA family DNA-binding protein [Streptomyces sp. DSM 40473]MDT0451553.1 ComEA family DNA-binding protein [Streptomyces sp. DSM 40473]